MQITGVPLILKYLAEYSAKKHEKLGKKRSQDLMQSGSEGESMLRLGSTQLSMRQIMKVAVWISLCSVLVLAHNVTYARELSQSASVWLPLLPNGEDGGGGDDGGGEPISAWAIFADTQWKTSSASIKRDAQGGHHLGYLYYEATDDEDAPTYGVYLYCASQCEEGANWNGVSFGERVTEIQVALTPDNQPRVLYRTSASEATGHDY